MTIRRTTSALVLFAAAIAAGPAPALAEGASTLQAESRAAPRPEPLALQPARIRASHRVDVIAPGERVDSVLDKLRQGSRATGAVEPGRPERSAHHENRGGERDGHDRDGRERAASGAAPEASRGTSRPPIRVPIPEQGAASSQADRPHR